MHSEQCLAHKASDKSTALNYLKEPSSVTFRGEGWVDAH